MSTYNPNNAPGFGQGQGGQFGGQPGGGQYNAPGPYSGQGGQGGQFGGPGQYGGQGGQGGPGGQFGGGGGFPPGGGAPYGPQGGGYGGGVPPRKSQSKVSTLLIVGIIGALLIGVVGWLVLGRNGGDTPPPPPPPPSTTSTLPSDPPSTPQTSPPSTETTAPPTTAPPTTTEPAPPPSGNEVDLGQNVIVTLPAGWTVEETEPGLAVVTNGSSYVTLQVFRPQQPMDAMSIMTGYVEQMRATFQNPEVSGPEAIEVGPNGTGAVMVMVGTRVTSAGSFEAVLGSTILSRNSDGVSALATILTVPQGWEPSIADYNTMVSDMAGDLLG